MKAGHTALYGLHVVTELLTRRPQEVSSLLLQERTQEDPAWSQLRKQAQQNHIPVIDCGKAELDRVTQASVHQGVVALCGDYNYLTLDQLWERIPTNQPPLLLLLDSVTDPHNVGALIRSAYVLGGHGIVLPQDRAAAITPTVVKSASGATEWLPIVKVPNLVRSMQALQEQGVWLYGASLHTPTAQPPWNIDWTSPTGLVLGSEGHGLRPLVSKTCDGHVYIPMQGRLRGGSLNVSASGAILLYEVARQRQLTSRSSQ